MALELDGKPYNLTKKDIAEYSKNMIFRVGMQHIRTNRDPELPPIEVSPIHIDTRYRHYKKGTSSGLKEPQGELIWFESKTYDAETKKNSYVPARIALGYTGYIESSDVEMNYFLDNHPNNEAVKANLEHPNYKPKSETYFSTYFKERMRDKLLATLKLSSSLTTGIMDPQENGPDELKSIALLVYKNSTAYSIAHKLHNIQDMNEMDLRAELARLCSLNPHAMADLIGSDRLDYLTWTTKFYDMKLIQISNNEWSPVVEGKPGLPIMKVAAGHDAVHSLADWFKNFDPKGTRFKELKTAYAVIAKNRSKQTA